MAFTNGIVQEELASSNHERKEQLLSELTGEDIWTKLQQMDLHEVLRTLEQARTQY